MTKEEELEKPEEQEEPDKAEAFAKKHGLHGTLRSCFHAFFRPIKSDAGGWIRMLDSELYLHVEIVTFAIYEKENVEIMLSPDTFIPFQEALGSDWFLPLIRRKSIAFKDGKVEYTDAGGGRKLLLHDGASFLKVLEECPAVLKKDLEKTASHFSKTAETFSMILEDHRAESDLYNAYVFVTLLRLFYIKFLDIVKDADTTVRLHRQRGKKQAAELKEYASALKAVREKLLKLVKNCVAAIKDIEYRPGFEVKYYNQAAAYYDNPAATREFYRHGTDVPFSTENGQLVVDATGIMN